MQILIIFSYLPLSYNFGHSFIKDDYLYTQQNFYHLFFHPIYIYYQN